MPEFTGRGEGSIHGGGGFGRIWKILAPAGPGADGEPGQMVFSGHTLGWKKTGPRPRGPPLCGQRQQVWAGRGRLGSRGGCFAEAAGRADVRRGRRGGMAVAGPSVLCAARGRLALELGLG